MDSKRFRAINIFVGLLILAFFGLYVYKAEAQVGTTAVRVSNSPTVFIAPGQSINAVPTGTTNVTINTSAGTPTALNKSVGPTLTRCNVSGGAPSSTRKKVCFKNNSAIDCYIGGSNVSTFYGFLLKNSSNEILCFDRDSSDFYCMCISAGGMIGILEVN